MHKKIAVVVLAVACLAIPVGMAQALRVAVMPGPTRVANADAVFVGKVIEIEPIDVDAKPYAGAKETVKYRIAVVKINEAIHGLKDEKTIRVGFIPFVQPKPGGPIIGGIRGRNPELQAGQEGLFMIKKHPEGKFYLAPDFGNFTSSQDKNLDKEIKSAKQVLAVMKDIKGSLQSKDADTRMMAAAIQVARYRTPKVFPNKEEPIDAEESKLILNVIANAKWGAFKFGDPNPQQLFFQLGINANDGFKVPPKINRPEDLQKAVQDWVKSNENYRIKRFVPAETK
ncbi:MAG TPA: hypothetical protein VFE62_20740 [Gemmataceae bacterium]|nr:hypothetical protein [Gemmataceae bacterium]